LKVIGQHASMQFLWVISQLWYFVDMKIVVLRAIEERSCDKSWPRTKRLCGLTASFRRNMT
jgi:hypothetical protein